MADKETERLLAIDQRALIVNSEGKVLVVKTRDYDWDLPGGLIEDSKTWRESLEDIIAETLNLQIMTVQPMFAADYQDPETGHYVYMSVVLSNCFDDTLDTADYEEARWIERSEVDSLSFTVFDIKEALLHHFDSAKA